MKKTIKRVFAILLTLVIAITMLPQMEAKATEQDMLIELSFDKTEMVVTDENFSEEAIQVVGEISGDTTNISHINIGFECSETYLWSTLFFYEGEWVGTIFPANATMPSGEYKLVIAEIYYTSGDSESLSLEKIIGTKALSVVNNVIDINSPVISNQEFAQNGQTFVQGEGSIIEFTANISDGEGVGMFQDNVFVKLASLEGANERVDFIKQADGTYKASINADDLTNTEWYVEAYVAFDRFKNETYYVPLEEGLYWHFYVKDENGTCNNDRTITVNFYDENNELLTTKTILTTKAEVELATKLDGIPSYTTDLGFVGWKCEETNRMLEEDTVFISTFIEEEYNFYPVTEMKRVGVALYILEEDGEKTFTGFKEYLIDFDATYQDLIALLPIPPKVKDCTFVEWDLLGFKLTDTIKLDSVILFAVYDKQVIKVDYDIVDENGELVNESIPLTFSKDEIITYEKVLSQMPQHETYEGMSFVKWNILDDPADLTEELDDDKIEIEAVYDKYPVTIERIYVDTTGAVKKDKITKLYPAGATLENIYDEYAVKPSDASTTLEIETWAVKENLSEISLYNNSLTMKAEYADCIIVEINYRYIAPMDDHGVLKEEFFQVVVSKEIASDEDALIAYCKECVEDKVKFTYYDGYVVSGWDYSYIEDFDEDGYFDSLNVSSIINYEDVITVLVVLDMSAGNAIYYYVVDAGETIVLPWQYNGKYLNWIELVDAGLQKMDGHSYTISKDAVKGDRMILAAEAGKKLPGKIVDTATIVDENKVLPLGVSIRAFLLEKGDEYTTAKALIESKLEEIKNFAIYDITLVNAKGILIEQLDKTIKVTFDLPFDVTDGKSYKIFRVDGDKLVECKTAISGGKVSFETDHFSTYVLVEQEKDNVVTQPVIPDKGDNAIYYAMVMLIGLGVVLITNKKRYLIK